MTIQLITEDRYRVRLEKRITAKELKMLNNLQYAGGFKRFGLSIVDNRRGSQINDIVVWLATYVFFTTSDNIQL